MDALVEKLKEDVRIRIIKFIQARHNSSLLQDYRDAIERLA